MKTPRHGETGWPIDRMIRLILLCVVLACGGCQVVGWFAHGVAGESVEPVYVLQDQPTLILVDDPEQHLGDPAMARLVATQAGYDLVQNKVLKPEHLIDIQKVDELRRGQDERKFARIPASQIGQRVQARQVLLVHIESSQLTSEPNVLRPVAKCQVKVIDCDTQKRLFPPRPEVASGIMPLGGDQGYIVNTTMTYRVTSDDYKNLTPIVRRAVAKQIGVQVAMLFYGHEPVKMTPQSLPPP